MNYRHALVAFAGVGAVGLVLTAAWFTRPYWLEVLRGGAAAVSTPSDDHAHDNKERVRLSPQARANLRLIVKPVEPRTYWRTIEVPGTVVERRGKSDRGVIAPIAGVVKRIAAVPGDSVRPEAELFTLGLTSETLQSSQTELYKTVEEIRITQAEKERIEEAVKKGAVVGSRLIELEYQVKRYQAVQRAFRQDLATRGLTPEQINLVEQGTFLKEITVRAPLRMPDMPEGHQHEPPLYEIEQLKVQLGEYVQTGQVLAHLADHHLLYIEGRGFKEDAALLERSATQGWPVAATFTENSDGDWLEHDGTLTIQYLANALDPASQTFPFFVPLTNQHHEYRRDGRTYRIWRYRPGQRVRLAVRVEELRDVFVLPAEAVVREGADVYVFRQNGEVFDRMPVHLLYEDSSHVVLANDGSILPGSHLAHNGAAALNRALKANAAEDSGGGHSHHGHSH